MIAKNLERLIGEIAHRKETEMVQRFQNLRNLSGIHFPSGRGKHAENLMPHQIVVGVLSIVPSKPGYTMYLLSLLSLKPVGGKKASFFGAETFSGAIQIILENNSALESFLELRASVSEIDAQGTGGTAEIIYTDENGKEKIAYFVTKNALTLMAEGAENTYNPRAALTQIREETIFYRELFQRIVESLEDEKEYKKVIGSINPDTLEINVKYN